MVHRFDGVAVAACANAGGKKEGGDQRWPAASSGRDDAESGWAGCRSPVRVAPRSICSAWWRAARPERTGLPQLGLGFLCVGSRSPGGQHRGHGLLLAARGQSPIARQRDIRIEALRAALRYSVHRSRWRPCRGFRSTRQPVRWTSPVGGSRGICRRLESRYRLASHRAHCA